MTKKQYEQLLAKAPKNHKSPKFIDFLRENNKVVCENPFWLIIENVKYNNSKMIWHTAFSKLLSPCLDYIPTKYGSWEWLKKAKDKQTVKRFHIHLYKARK